MPFKRGAKPREEERRVSKKRCVCVCTVCVLCVYCADLFVPNVRVTAKQDSMVCNIMRPISACMQESNSESEA